MAEITKSSALQVSIIGAGPGGLLLARYLQQNSIHCKIYEQDPSEHHRTQGGSLDLHEGSGQLAMREAGLMDEFWKLARRDAEQMKLYDKIGKLWVNDDEEKGRPEIDRTDLRKILIDSLKLDTIQWGYQLISAHPLDGSSGYVLNFSNGTSRHVDILIGADGAWSRIRSLLTAALPIYTSITFIELVISDSDIRFPHLASLIGKGITFITSDNKAIIPQRNSYGTVRVYIGLRVPEHWIDDHPLPSDPTEARQFLLSLFKGWSPSVLELIASVDDAPVIPRKLVALPPSLTWTTTLRGITLIGDAAHVMSPFAGEGVNLAMLDAYTLGKELVDSQLGTGEDFDGEEKRAAMLMRVDEGFRRYEREMWEKAREKAEESALNLDAMFAKDAPRAFVEAFKTFGRRVDPK